MSFRTLPPTHFAVLKSTDWATPHDLWAGFKAFVKKIRDKYRRAGHDFQYYMRVEQGEGLHVHLLVRTRLDLDKGDLRELAQRACGDEIRFYWEPVRSADNAARYLPKHWYDKVSETSYILRTPWLPGPEWYDIPLVQASRRFLSHARAELWDMVKAEWFDGQEQPDWDSLPTWAASPPPEVDDPATFDLKTYESTLIDAFLETWSMPRSTPSCI